MKLTSSALVLVLLALAGCGGSDSGFTDDYNQAVKPLSELEQGMGTKPREFDRLADRTEQTRRNLAKLDPPDDGPPKRVQRMAFISGFALFGDKARTQ